MPRDLTDITLDNLAKGAAHERFDLCMKKVAENVADPNTDPEKVRKITLTITIKPHADRSGAIVNLVGTTKLAPYKPAAGQLFFGKRGDETVAVGFDPSQLSLMEEEQQAKDATGVVPITSGKEKASGE